MERVPVMSSNLKSVGYDRESQILEIEFLNGAIYQYYGVSPTTYSGLMEAPSHGKFVHSHIKGVYRHQRIA